MPTDSMSCESPIDVMYMIHHALRAEAAGVEQSARHLGTTGTLAAFAQAFLRWARALEYHAVTEDTSMTPLLPDRPSVRDNEAEHKRLTARFNDLQTFLHTVQHQAAVTPHMQRQVLGKVIALRIEQDDHLENEEELVLPTVRQRLSEAQQCEIARRLLSDGEAQKEGGMLTWITTSLTTTEQQALAALTARWKLVPLRASSPCRPSCEDE